MKKLSKIFMGIKLGVAVGKTIATGKTAKVLDKVDKYADLSAAVKDLIENTFQKKKE